MGASDLTAEQQTADKILQAIPEALGMQPDPWADEPGTDGEPHATVAKLVAEYGKAKVEAAQARADALQEQVKELEAWLQAERLRLDDGCAECCPSVEIDDVLTRLQPPAPGEERRG